MPSFECIVLLKRLLKGKKKQIMTFLVFLLTTFFHIEEPMLNILALMKKVCFLLPVLMFSNRR